MFIVRFYGDTRSHNVIKELMDAGGVASIQTDQSAEQDKCVREYGAFLIRHGLSEERALEALTINGARMMMLTDRIGSIEVGKDADLVIKRTSLLDPTTPVETVLVNGRIAYQREAPR
jgi:imidazolonepropionase-like amidohydrolase